MKKILIAMFVVLLFATGCSDTTTDLAEDILEGEHQLHRMVERTEQEGSLSGGFFLFSGGVNGSTTTETQIKFAWQMNDGTYAYSSLPLEKIRLRIDNSVETPTIEFSWEPVHNDWIVKETQRLMDASVVYATVTINEKDWPSHIPDLP